MKKLYLLAGTSLLALAVALPAAHATTFKYTGKIVSYLVPAAGTYKIVAFGAQGGSSGGSGAKIAGDFKLGKGQDLLIAVGGEGANGFYSGGGGGGSFVVEKLPNPLGDLALVIAGGGGGSGGGGGGTGTAGGGGGGAYAGGGGTGGKGGAGGGFPNGYGGGGGGFSTSGGSTEFAQGGGSFLSGAAGGGGGCGAEYGQPFGCANGGFGGGGGGGIGAGGAGGGYSGGGGGGFEGGGGGGGSLDDGTKRTLKAAFNSGNGLVRITEVKAASSALDASLVSVGPAADGDTPAVPEPASAALLGAGLVGFAGFAARRRRSGQAS